jgi:hypothetical protein
MLRSRKSSVGAICGLMRCKKGLARQELPIQQPHRVGYACRDPDTGLDEVNDGEDAQRSHHAACTKA